MGDYGVAALVIAVLAIVLIIILFVVIFFEGSLIGRFTDRYVIQKGGNANETLITGSNNLYISSDQLTNDITLTVIQNSANAEGTPFAVKNNSGTRNIRVVPGEGIAGPSSQVANGAFAQFVFTSPTTYIRLS